MGDQTQLPGIVLATTFRRPLRIIAGILVATLANHAAAAAVGGWVPHALGPDLLRWLVGLAFLGIAVWMLVGDRMVRKASVRVVHAVAAAIFVVLGLLTLFNLGHFP